MRLIVDCSVVASFLLEDEQHPYSLIVKKQFSIQEIHVSPLFWSEIANVFLHRERRKLMRPEETDFLLSGLKQTSIITHSLDDMELMTTLARRYQLTSYDASYLALAKQQRAKLATLDEGLKKAAISENLFYNPA
jgi:predicted nucleic acid-binding protein